ncbi:hypothetical protein TNCV_2366811 [Trichonephila clavipes]|nr:hypothetical protein TNCV_2366811 [Trichonephila clavipes]
MDCKFDNFTQRNGSQPYGIATIFELFTKGYNSWLGAIYTMNFRQLAPTEVGGRSRSLPPNYYGHLTLADERCGNSSLFINSWEGISELGPRRHKETHEQCVLFTPDPVTIARLETHNVYPGIGAHGTRARMRRNRWDRLKDNSSKEPSPIRAGKGQNIRG